MGRIDAIIDDSIEQQFRMEAIKRFGARKGNLSKALEDAMELWMKNDVIENIKHRILKEKGITNRDDLIETLKTQGKASLPAFSQLLDSHLLNEEKAQITRIIRELSLQKNSF